MSQAEKPNNMNRLSRRNALAGLAGIAAGGAAVLPAAAGVLTGEHSDADLLALASEFDPLFEEWRALKVASLLDHEEFEAELVRRTGLTRAQAPCGHVPDREGREQHPYWGQFEKIHADGIGRRVEPGRWDTLLEALNPLADEVLEFRATTREGLALQVKAFIASYNQCYESSCFELEGDDDEEPCSWAVRRLIVSLCDSVGVQWPPYDMKAGEPVLPVQSELTKPDGNAGKPS
jgi:hypothetical protein